MSYPAIIIHLLRYNFILYQVVDMSFLVNIQTTYKYMHVVYYADSFINSLVTDQLVLKVILALFLIFGWHKKCLRK